MSGHDDAHALVLAAAAAIGDYRCPDCGGPGCVVHTGDVWWLGIDHDETCPLMRGIR